MRARWLVIWLTVSVVLNVVLFSGWLASVRPAPAPIRPVVRRPIVTNLLRPIRTNVLFQPRLLSWKDIESEDYETYVRNLRGIGCPPQTVHDIILADVNAYFARKVTDEVPHPSRQWWRLEPDAAMEAQIAEKTAALERERSELLATLLGEDWAENEPMVVLDGGQSDLGGPILGDLSETAVQQVRAIERWARERAEQPREPSGTDGSPGIGSAAAVERELRARLAAVLTPEQLEEYLLRHSVTAQRLREQFSQFELTADEFRTVFQATDALDTQRAEVTAAQDASPQAQERIADLERQEQEALEKALGPGRYLQFRLNQDAVFRETWAVAERAGLTAEQVIPIYQVNQTAQQERRRVLADATLTPEDQARQLAELYEQRLLALRTLVGEEGFQRLQAAEELP